MSSEFAVMGRSTGYRSGWAVCWHYFKTEADAKAAAVIAHREAEEQAARGYDFGFCSPGSVVKMADDAAAHAGEWEVCFP